MFWRCWKSLSGSASWASTRNTNPACLYVVILGPGKGIIQCKYKCGTSNGLEIKTS
ncbi:hypothetical protein DPMN_028981 [Dreissena polymorpha]|uniref:Uncharacterized protein n=1 Tax=Dreissena polymorpha TaxID=45954 RepID=A0A9D4RF20_DREPO|nr:hypothetical protein DPMN_028981 [Dreissena polymorpha]